MWTGLRLMAGWVFPKPTYPAKSWNRIQSQSFILLRSLAGAEWEFRRRVGYGKWQRCNHSRSFGKTGAILFRQAFPVTHWPSVERKNAFSINLETVAGQGLIKRVHYLGLLPTKLPRPSNEASLIRDWFFLDQRLIKWRQRWSSCEILMDHLRKLAAATSCTDLKGPFNLKWWIHQLLVYRFYYIFGVDFNLIAIWWQRSCHLLKSNLSATPPPLPNWPPISQPLPALDQSDRKRQMELVHIGHTSGSKRWKTKKWI